MTWRVARSLLTLREQIDDAFPNRNKASDGTIGDADHQNRSSDHNPWYGPGIVTALDITHDPEHGVDIDRLTDELQASRDPRIKYVIANRWIMDTRPGFNPWQWVPYNGSNPHTRHMHVSCVASPACDDTDPWNLPSLTGGGGNGTTGRNDDVEFSDTFTTRYGRPLRVDHYLAWSDYRITETKRTVDQLADELAEMRQQLATVVDELTRARPSRGNPDYSATLGEYVVNADHYAYRAMQQTGGTADE